MSTKRKARQSPARVVCTFDKASDRPRDEPPTGAAHPRARLDQARGGCRGDSSPQAQKRCGTAAAFACTDRRSGVSSHAAVSWLRGWHLVVESSRMLGMRWWTITSRCLANHRRVTPTTARGTARRTWPCSRPSRVTEPGRVTDEHHLVPLRHPRMNLFRL